MKADVCSLLHYFGVRDRSLDSFPERHLGSHPVSRRMRLGVIPAIFERAPYLVGGKASALALADGKAHPRGVRNGCRCQHRPAGEKQGARAFDFAADFVIGLKRQIVIIDKDVLAESVVVEARSQQNASTRLST